MTKRQQVLWFPFPGPQTAYCAATEFEVLFGGAKGPGKSDSGLMSATRQTEYEAYKALILRETFPELQELVDRSHSLFPKMASKPKWNGETRRWTWPSGATMEFGYCSKPEDVQRYQGREWGHVFFDEIGNVPDERVWISLMAEVRCRDPRVIKMMRGSANPGKAGHAWVKRRFINPCGMDGSRIHHEKVTLPDGSVSVITRRYIPAKVTDNPIYAKDPLYMAQLMSLPEMLRRQLLYGDWDAGYGSALEELSREKHIIKPFDPPEAWLRFGAFDWGYAHPWTFGEFAVDEDGVVYMIDSVKGRRDRPDEIIDAIQNKFNLDRLNYIVAGHDVFQKRRAMGDNTPSIAEMFQERGITLAPANIDRVPGLNNMRRFIAWRGIGKGGRDADPAFRIMATATNDAAFEQLQSVVINPDRMEDALKVDADPDTGEGGDDFYDMIRYALASRPERAPGSFFSGNVQAFSKETLYHEYEKGHRDAPLSPDEELQRIETFIDGLVI